MKITVYAKEGQTHCSECGAPFVEVSSAYSGGINIATGCPNGCNRGSWVRLEPEGEYCVPIEMDLRGLRRKIEDRIRKDPAFFKKILMIRGN